MLKGLGDIFHGQDECILYRTFFYNSA